MKVRQIEPEDRTRLMELFEGQNFEYTFPDFRKFVAAQCVEDEDGIQMAVLARPTVELYFLCNPEWRNPAWRMKALTLVHESMRLELNGKGVEDVHVWIPPQKKSFVRRLMRDFGWTAPLWTDLTRPTAPRGNHG